MENQLAIEKNIRRDANELLREVPETKYAVVTDRHVFSGFAYSLHQRQNEAFPLISFYNHLPKSEFVILFVATEEDRQKRLVERGAKRPLHTSPHVQNNYLHILASEPPGNVLIINTSLFDLPQTQAMVADARS